jgi:hypothetical protein
MTLDNPFSITILDDIWQVYLVDDDDDVIADADCAAQTNAETKELYFRRGHISLSIIMHELWHVYFSSLHLHDTTSICLSDLEEITACLFESRAEAIINNAKKLQTELLARKDIF